MSWLIINNLEEKLMFFICKSEKIFHNRCWVKRFVPFFCLSMCWWHPILRPIKTDMLLINSSLDEAFFLLLWYWLLASICICTTSLNYRLPEKEKVMWFVFFSSWEKKQEEEGMIFAVLFFYAFDYLQIRFFLFCQRLFIFMR